MDATTKSLQLNINNITKQEHTKAEHKRATERIQSELRPKPDSSKWFEQQASINRGEKAQRAAEIAGQTVREMLKPKLTSHDLKKIEDQNAYELERRG